jgi:hypothetical protein
VALDTRAVGAGISPAVCSRVDGGQNALEMGRLEAVLAPDLSQIHPKKGH